MALTSFLWIIAQVPLHTTNLIGLNLDPRGLEDAPPEIRLPPGVSPLPSDPNNIVN